MRQSTYKVSYADSVASALLKDYVVLRFIESPNRNLKVAGIVALSGLVQVDPSYIAMHQLAVIDCLDDRDETLRTETLKLLSQTTNSTNAVAVVQKLLQSAT